MFWKKDSVKKEKTSSKAVTVISVLSLLVLILFIVFMRYLQRKNDESTINVGEQLKQTEDAKARKEKAIKELALNEISHGKDADYVEIYNASNMVIDQCHLVNQFQIKIQWFSFRESHCFFSSKT